MKPVNVLPAFVSQDTDLKNKDSSGTSVDSNKDVGFSSLVAQHLTDENKVNSGKKSTATAQTTSATQGKAIAANGKNDLDEINSRQESDSNESLEASKSSKAAMDERLGKEKDAEKGGSLAKSEQFISLLYNSDQTLAQATEPSKGTSTVNASQGTDAIINSSNVVNTNVIKTKDNNGQAETVQSEDHESKVLVSEHRLSAFSKDELFARAQLKNNNALAPQASDQALKDYQLSLQSQQNAIKNQSITSEQLMNTQLANSQLNNKVTDLAAGVSQANKNQLTEQVDTGLYQLPVEPIGKENFTAGDVSHSAKESVAKGEENQGDIDAELATEVTNIPATKKLNSSSEVLNVNPSNS